MHTLTKNSSAQELLGHIDTTGRYCPTAFRIAFEKGAPYLVDATDANSDVMAVLFCAAMAGMVEFPDAVVEAHSDFVLVFAVFTPERKDVVLH